MEMSWLITILLFLGAIFLMSRLGIGGCGTHGSFGGHGGCGTHRSNGHDSEHMSGDQTTKSALEILNERYVKGDISQEEYARIKEEILNNKPG